MSGLLDQEYSLPLPILEVKAAAGEAGEPEQRLVEGYVSVFGGPPDLGNDVVLPGAFDATLTARAEGAHKVRFLRQHDHNQVLGTVLELKADDHGLLGRFKLSRTPLGEETYQLLKDGALDSFSIGYRADDFDHKDGGVRELKRISLFETSIVAVPMAPRALITSVKGHAAELPFDALWQQIRDAFASLDAGLAEAKALRDRRAADGRELAERHRTELSRTLAAAEATLEELRPLAQTLSREEPPEAAGAAVGGLRLRLELARRRLQRAGVLEPLR